MRAKRRQVQVLLGFWENARPCFWAVALEYYNNFSDDWTDDQLEDLDRM